MIFSGVTILQGVEFPIFLLIFAWALQQCSATALPVINPHRRRHLVTVTVLMMHFLPFCHNDRQTDRRTDFSSLYRVSISCSSAKKCVFCYWNAAYLERQRTVYNEINCQYKLCCKVNHYRFCAAIHESPSSRLKQAHMSQKHLYPRIKHKCRQMYLLSALHFVFMDSLYWYDGITRRDDIDLWASVGY